MLKTKKIKDTPLRNFLVDLMRRRRCLPSKFAADIGVSHATVHRWLTGKDIPSLDSCQRISRYSGMSLPEILYSMGQIHEKKAEECQNWPEFREYASVKYSDLLDEDIISMVEDLIERRRIKGKAENN